MSIDEIRLPGIVLVRAGVTSLELQGRLVGRLDIGMAPEGELQIELLSEQLQARRIQACVSAPGMPSVQTAERLCKAWKIRNRPMDSLANVDFGLWHGRLIEDLQKTQPRLFRMLEERPDCVCPPQGEPLVEVRERVRNVLVQLGNKFGNRSIAIVVPGPIAAIIRSLYLGQSDFDQPGIDLFWENLQRSAWMEFPPTTVAIGDDLKV